MINDDRVELARLLLAEQGNSAQSPFVKRGRQGEISLQEPITQAAEFIAATATNAA